MSSQNKIKAKKQVKPRTAEAIIEAIAAQMDRREEAERRIKEEGIVVRDLRGAIVPHPAIKIEKEATKLIAELIAKFG